MASRSAKPKPSNDDLQLLSSTLILELMLVVLSLASAVGIIVFVTLVH